MGTPVISTTRHSFTKDTPRLIVNNTTSVIQTLAGYVIGVGVGPRVKVADRSSFFQPEWYHDLAVPSKCTACDRNAAQRELDQNMNSHSIRS